MTVDPPEGRPLNLRDLASVESPDVVAAALRRFRRRTLTRGVWAAGLVLAVLLVAPLLPGRRSLPERYYASPIVGVARSASAGSITVTAINAARLDRETGGIHLIASTGGAEPISIVAVYRGASAAPGKQLSGVDVHQGPEGRVSEAFVALPLGTSAITVELFAIGGADAPEATTAVTIDLSGSPELQRLWR